jgi:signal transduction histidine kinase
MRSLLPRSLRSRLILSFGILIFLSLFLAGTTTVYLLKAEREKTAREKIGRLATTIGLRSAFLEASGASPAQIEGILEQEYDARILLLDKNATVVTDTGKTLAGATIAQIPQPQPAIANAQGRASQPQYNVQELSQGSEQFLLFVAPAVRTLRIPGGGSFSPNYQTVVAVKSGDLTQAWRELLPRLFLAGSIAFFVSVFAAGLLARPITRPLQQITSAAEEMAQGHYDQQLPRYGGEEVSRLSGAFNAMARQVSHSHRTLRDFLANVSHELKTPLTSIQGFSQAMVDGAVSTPREYAEVGRIINDEAVRMRGLVDDLLYISQVEAGEVVMHPDDISPNDLLKSTRERFANRAEQSNVDLQVFPGAMPIIHADARRLEQALANITDNAIRHTPSGGRVTLRSGSQDGHVMFSVHNTGSYIPEAQQHHIFERFYQADPDRARANGNTGLGLAITQDIVEAHGGHVAVASTPDDGTTFTITLPSGSNGGSYEDDAAWARPADAPLEQQPAS